jgi:hypothetical protein
MLLPLWLSVLHGAASAAVSANDRREIDGVVEAFRTAIIQRDKPRFLSLFIQPDLPWQSVLEDQSLVQLRAKDPAAHGTRRDRVHVK